MTPTCTPGCPDFGKPYHDPESTHYVPVAEGAARIRAALKAKGWGSREVSVRSESYSMGSSIRVTIRSARVPLPVVKNIAEEQEHVRYCEYSGEILAGGNRYVTVGYSAEALKALGAPHVEAVRAAAAKARGNSLIQIETAPTYLVGLWHGRAEGPLYSLWGDRRIFEETPEGIAARVGQLLLAAEEA